MSPNRAERRRRAKAATKDTPRALRLKYTLELPGGPLRSPYGLTIGETLEAEDEATLAQSFAYKMLAASGLSQDERAITGFFAEMVNPFSPRVRGFIAYAIMQGYGQKVWVAEDVVMCRGCGAEKSEVTPEPEHNEKCPCIGYEVAAEPDNAPEVVSCDHGVEEGCWLTSDIVRVDLPRKYTPLDVSATATPVAPAGDDVQSSEIIDVEAEVVDAS